MPPKTQMPRPVATRSVKALVVMQVALTQAVEGRTRAVDGPFPHEFLTLSAGGHVFTAEAFDIRGASRKVTLKLTVVP